VYAQCRSLYARSDLCALLWRQGHRTKRQGQYIPNGREAISPTMNSQFPAARQGHNAPCPPGAHRSALDSS
jgi:hypothetical protein